MAVTRTGTASQVNGSGGSGSTSVTVPADATGAIAFWAWYAGGTTPITAMTLGGNSFLSGGYGTQLNDGATTGVGVAFLNTLPGTGSQTFAWTWTGGARTEGGEIVVVWVKGQDTSSPVRDSGADQQESATNVTVTVDSSATDLVIAFASSTEAAMTLDNTRFITDATLNLHEYEASEITPGASTTTVNMTGENYSTMAAISLREVTVSEIKIRSQFLDYDYSR